MNDSDHAYCRLCATCKPNNRLIDLQEDIEKREEIESKLLVLKFKLDFNEINLPKTICLVCVTSLSCAADFVTAVERAQVALKDISSTQAIKEDNDSSNSEDEDNIDIKSASDTDDSDVAIKPDMNTATKKKKVNDKDSLSVSQLKQTWKGYKWTCVYCAIRFPTCLKLIMHSIDRHNTCNTYHCSDCSVIEFSLNSFLKHVYHHRKHLKYSCYICFKTFQTTHKVLKHMRTIHMTSSFMCNGCNIPFLSLEELNNHSMFVRSNPEPDSE